MLYKSLQLASKLTGKPIIIKVYLFFCANFVPN
nr:MAG TPA_asm: hypothetical protein [Caudoviricetes sp.]